MKTIAAEPAGGSFYDLLLSEACMSSSLENDQAQGAYFPGGRDPYCIRRLDVYILLLFMQKRKATNGICVTEARRRRGPLVFQNLL